MQNAIPPGGPLTVQGAPPPPDKKFKGKLLGVRKGRIKAPCRILTYGTEGVGKSTWASQAEDVIFLCKEGGTEQLDIARLPEPTHWRDAPMNESIGMKCDVFNLINHLRFAEHDYKALAIDTIDWLEPLLFRYVCESGTKKVANIVHAHGGFGKGYDIAVDEWRALIVILDALRKERGMHIILLAHSHVKKFANPEGEDYDRYQLKMHDKGAGVLKEWCDAVFFAHQEVFAGKKATSSEENPKMFGVSTMQRFLYTQRRPAWDAKNRFNLPEKIPMSWADMMTQMQANSPANVDALLSQIKEASSFLSVENQHEVQIALARADGDFSKLLTTLNWIHANQQPEEEKTE